MISPSRNDDPVQSPGYVIERPLTSLQRLNLVLYPRELKKHEKIWRDRHDFLLTHGYKLRPRYEPGWVASWTLPGAEKDPMDCEDSNETVRPMVLDARRTKDEMHVCIKRIKRITDEVAIAQYLTSNALLQDPKNHCVPVLDSFSDPELPEVSYMVMPVLRTFDDPDFGARGEVVDFVTQLLKGMAFMHDHLVAHSDLTRANIMMDARPIFPKGWHFATNSFTEDGTELVRPLARVDHPVRYYIIDFDFSVRFLPGQSSIIKGLGGRDHDAPELHTHLPFDHFKLDVFTVGNLFKKDFKEKFLGLEFLSSLIDMMTTHDFRNRPTAQASLDHWYTIRDGIPVSSARWPLRKPDESVGERVVNTVVAARAGVNNLRYLFEEDKRTWANP